jgi:hypothetical protein
LEGQIVISFRAPGGPGRSFLERARALEARARAHGAVLIGWDASRVSFAFEPTDLAEATELCTTRGADTAEGEAAWCVGVAQGMLERLASDGSRADLAWGPPLVAASILSQKADPGEILCAQSVRALASGELLGVGLRVGRDGDVRVRGIRLDSVRPWRSQAAAQLTRMRVAPLVGPPPPPATVEAGSLRVLRADAGMGGTRYLSELAARAPRALVVVPAGSGFEPLGALRRALARSLTRELSPLVLELTGPLDALLAGEAVALEMASRLVTAFLGPKTGGQGPGLLLLDDVKGIDPATLEACAHAARRTAPAELGIVARLDATGALPSVLAALPRGDEIAVPTLGREAAESLANGCVSGALDETARRRWAKLGAHLPLAVVEAVSYGIVTGDLRWNAELASPRSRASGRGKARSAADWILLRARDESAPSRTLLCLVALLGGEAKVTRLSRVLEHVRAPEPIDVERVLQELICGRWLVDTQEDWVGLPSRTHREALAGLLDADARAPLHRAAAEVIAAEEGVFGRVEAAWHAAHVGDGPAAARILLLAARATAKARVSASTPQLIAFARRADPSCEESALELLASALEPTSRLPPPGSESAAESTEEDLAAFEVDTAHDSEPPTLAKLEVAPMSQEEIVRAVEPGIDLAASVEAAFGANIAAHLGELVKDALLSADNAALERWVDGLSAAGESPLFTERLRALSRLGRGDIGNALRSLRRARSALGPKEYNLRCQTSLALGVALSVAGRPQEALLEAMDALAQARSANDDRGASACLAFLAKLYTSAERPEAELLRSTASA